MYRWVFNLGIVKHANNVKYVEWYLNYLELKNILTKRIKAINLNFIEELNLGDTITIRIGMLDNIMYFKFLRNELGSILCEIEIASS